MLNPASTLSRLFDAPMRPGRVEWIGLRPARRAVLRPVLLAGMEPEGGLAGDHYRNRQSRARQGRAQQGMYRARRPTAPARRHGG